MMKIKRVDPRGLGDTLKEIFDKTGVSLVFKVIENNFDVDCGCKKRQEKLNKLFPYERNKNNTET